MTESGQPTMSILVTFGCLRRMSSAIVSIIVLSLISQPLRLIVRRFFDLHALIAIGMKASKRNVFPAVKGEVDWKVKACKCLIARPAALCHCLLTLDI